MYDNILPAVEQIKEVFNAEAVYIFGVKYNSQQMEYVTDFDVCIVAEFEEEDRNALLKKAYMQTDCDVPFDIFLYTPEDFEKFSKDPGSFVSRILRVGRLYYGKTK